MDNDNVKNGICFLLMWCIASLIFLLICVTENQTLMPIAYKIFPISNLFSWLGILYLMSRIKYNSSILIRILLTLISLAIVGITFFSTKILFSSLFFLLVTILLVNDFFYLLENTKW